MAPFPGLLSFAPLLGPSFVDGKEDFVVTTENTVTVSVQLTLSLLGLPRERFSNNRSLSKHFLELARVAVNDFLMQLPSRRRTSAQATKYPSMTPVAVTKVAIKYADMDTVHMVIAPVLTNTGEVDPIAFLGLLCYMVHIQEAAFMWLVEEVCSGAQLPLTRKARRSTAAAAAGSAGATDSTSHPGDAAAAAGTGAGAGLGGAPGADPDGRAAVGNGAINVFNAAAISNAAAVGNILASSARATGPDTAAANYATAAGINTSAGNEDGADTALMVR